MPHQLLVQTIDSILFGSGSGGPAVKKDVYRRWQLRLLLFAILMIVFVPVPSLITVTIYQGDSLSTLTVVAVCCSLLLDVFFLRLVLRWRWPIDRVLTIMTLAVVFQVSAGSFVVSAWGRHLGFYRLAVGPAVMLHFLVYSPAVNRVSDLQSPFSMFCSSYMDIFIYVLHYRRRILMPLPCMYFFCSQLFHSY
jgi:hypothetical protein